MNRIDDILDNLKGQQPMIDDPEALTDRIMSSLPDLEPSQQDDESRPQKDEDKARIIRWRWPAILAVAASVAATLMLVWPKAENNPEEPSVLAEVVPPRSPQPTDTPHEPFGHTIQDRETASPKQAPLPKESHPTKAESQVITPQGQATSYSYDHNRDEYLPLPASNEPQVHYASIKSAVDTINYKDPARMDEFIAKMADFNEVEGVSLDCTGGAPDSTVISKAYVFDDTQELNIFGRLLQVACWYDSKTPGYLLNFSHQQLFFTLKDLHKNQKYLWIAERILGDRILLYCTHSPIETNVSSTCYQNYREQLTRSTFKSLPF